MNIFQKGKFVFVPELAGTPNVLAAFRKDFTAAKGCRTELIIAAHTFYRIYLNGRQMGIGPGPAPFGQLKTDRYDLTGLVEEENKLAIEVMGYVPEENNYATHETSCLIAEIVSDGKVIEATDGSWKCGVLRQKDCNVETLSFGRRVPLEAYNLDASYTEWRTGEIPGGVNCEEIEAGRSIREREVLMPGTSIYDCLRLTGVYGMKTEAYDGKERSWWESEDYRNRCGGDKMSRPSIECVTLTNDIFDGRLTEEAAEGARRTYKVSEYEKPVALEFAMDISETGLIGISFHSEQAVTVDIIWNDYLDENGEVPVKADSVNRVIRLKTEGGDYRFEAMEPHYIKYIKVIVRGGETFTLRDLYVRVYRYPDNCGAGFVCSDMTFNRIYESARRTLLTNSLAFFLDSPERERGGWAGDSYWTGRAAAVLLSDTSLERAMLYDFLAADYSPMLEGSFPACCSGGKKKDPVMMYSWNLFVLLELTDYYRRTGDEELKEAFKERTALFMESSKKLKNEIGVLENIPGSMFIDWSTSNDQANTQPVCTSANGLYAMIADRLGAMYQKEEYREEAVHIRLIFRREYEKVKAAKHDLFSMYPYMADSMTLKGKELFGNGTYSEAAQYYYFWTGLLRQEDAPELWCLLKEQFGPAPEKYRGTAHLRVGNCGVFFGYMMRFELLSRFGETELLEREMKELCGYMLNQDPGTFWETLDGKDSRNHGFGSHYGVVLLRDFLGVDLPDKVEKKVSFAPRTGSLKWAKGSINTLDGRVSAYWNKAGEGFTMGICVPEGYKAEAEIPKEFACYQEMFVNGKREKFSRYVKGEKGLEIRLDNSCKQEHFYVHEV